MREAPRHSPCRWSVFEQRNISVSLVVTWAILHHVQIGICTRHFYDISPTNILVRQNRFCNTSSITRCFTTWFCSQASSNLYSDILWGRLKLAPTYYKVTKSVVKKIEETKAERSNNLRQMITTSWVISAYHRELYAAHQQIFLSASHTSQPYPLSSKIPQIVSRTLHRFWSTDQVSRIATVKSR